MWGMCRGGDDWSQMFIKSKHNNHTGLLPLSLYEQISRRNVNNYKQQQQNYSECHFSVANYMRLTILRAHLKKLIQIMDK